MMDNDDPDKGNPSSDLCPTVSKYVLSSLSLLSLHV